MTAEIVNLADRRRTAQPPPPTGNAASAVAALAAACRALTASLDRVRQHAAAIRADMERLQRGAATAEAGGSVILDAAQALAGMSRSLAEPAHA